MPTDQIHILMSQLKPAGQTRVLKYAMELLELQWGREHYFTDLGLKVIPLRKDPDPPDGGPPPFEVLHSIDGTILDCNQAYTDFTGCQIGEKFLPTVPDDTRRRIEQRLQTLSRRAPCFFGKFETPIGGVCFVAARATFHQDRIIGIHVIGWPCDISSR